MTNFDQFLSATQDEMDLQNVELIMTDTSHVKLPKGKMECNGYFVDQPVPQFACGIGKPLEEWMPVYVHEYCHYTQWRDSIPEWDNTWIDGIYYDDFLESWIELRQDFPKKTINQFIDAGIAIEADCERRALVLIEENELPIDLDEYAQAANAYVHFYNYIRKHRKWYEVGKEPYNIKHVVSEFNTTIDDDFSISYEYIDLYERYCFK